MTELKNGWVSITYRGKAPKVEKHGSKAHLNAMSAHPEDGRPKVKKVANAGQDLSSAEQKKRGIPSATKAQPKSDDKAQAKEADK